MSEQKFPAGAPCWIDLLTSDVERSNAFYERIFGWTAGAGAPEFGGYYMYFLDGAPIAGGMPNSPSMETADRWGIHVNTVDAQATSAAVARAGGKALSDVMEIGSMGLNAMFADPAGSEFGIWQAKEFAGCSVMAAVGAPCWFELGTSDYDSAVEFYGQVLGLEASVMSDDPGFKYTTLGAGGSPLAGIMDTRTMGGPLRDGWNVYFGVADTDEVLGRVPSLGGSVTGEAKDSPFGRVAEVADPAGVRFSVVSVQDEGCPV
ncbi:VOC family protein [Spelaeicoccus albus]|uniref:VOC domain-containing protein n=1 Tax=Spelaeicoccus albus TaxID=1280376 RepID=A0A7Z0A9A5_9MICO|nr:VOC family protein [Spelaeicoccus albus]NYI66772.1 hypothetical protein [Spelaeicoccus albus]